MQIFFLGWQHMLSIHASYFKRSTKYAAFCLQAFDSENPVKSPDRCIKRRP